MWGKNIENEDMQWRYGFCIEDVDFALKIWIYVGYAMTTLLGCHIIENAYLLKK